jgi:acetyl esterase/lipase
MISSSGCFSVLKNLSLLLLLLAVAIPIHYDSANPKHLQLRLFHSLLTIKHRLISDTNRPKLSAEYRAFENLMQSVPVFDYDPAADPLETTKNMRTTFRFDLIVPRPSKCLSRKQVYEFDGSPAEVYWVDYRTGISNNQNEDRILLYFHGGGYMVGDFNSKSCFSLETSVSPSSIMGGLKERSFLDYIICLDTF